MEVAVMIGLQGSGKTTFVRQRLSTHAHVSKDHFPNARNRERRQQRLIEQALEAGRSVVVDNTNPSAVERASILDLARRYGAQAVAYYFDTDFAGCLLRNQAREGTARVPDVALKATARRLERPRLDEGWDRVVLVRLTDRDFVLEPSAPQP